MSDLESGSAEMSRVGGAVRMSKGLLLGGAVIYLVTMGLFQYNFARMQNELESVDQSLQHTNSQLSALGNLEMLKTEMTKLDENLTAMRSLMGPFPNMADSVNSLNDQIAGLSRTIVMLQGDTSGLPSVSASIQQMSAELRGITDRLNEMNRNVAGTTGSVSGMHDQVGSIQADLGHLQRDVADMDARLKIIPKAGN